jgi:hypothetical protein
MVKDTISPPFKEKPMASAVTQASSASPTGLARRVVDLIPGLLLLAAVG